VNDTVSYAIINGRHPGKLLKVRQTNNMSISQTKPEETSSDHLFCPQCNAALPQRATFCSSCGERLKRKKETTLLNEEDINNRYRITTLVRRRPHINLYFALDNFQLLPTGQPRMVAIRDIEIMSLREEARTEAIALVRQEYDQLRRWHIPHLLTSIDLRIFEGHLFLVSGMPLVSQVASASAIRDAQRLYTLQDFLQSGQGLPKEARALEWIRNLCQAVERLHRQRIVLGDLDPYTVVLNKNGLTAEPKLIVSWLRPELQKLLPPPTATPQISYFSAPEAIQGEAAVRSDVYSIGALLYLLLTGTPPDESTLRHRRRLRAPREINFRISQHVDECVMQALAIEPAERFASIAELMAALENPHFRQAPRKVSGQLTARPPEVSPDEAETVRIVPLSQKNVARWRVGHEEQQGNMVSQSTEKASGLNTLPPVSTPLPPTSGPISREKPSQEKIKALPATPFPQRQPPAPSASVRPGRFAGRPETPPSPSAEPKPNWKGRITGILPQIKPEWRKEEVAPARTGKTASRKSVVPPIPKNESDSSLLKQLQRMILGRQQHAVEAAAIIETPMRIRPDQSYNLRIHIMGRDEPTVPADSKKNAVPAGLSALVHGEGVLVEVRSVLQQGYTYILQQATVTIPANGYAAEVTIPMQPQQGGASGRRDRLHVFFLDQQRNPLYEKPFIVEVFVSPLVQFGREGHQVLTIPL
jgi:serine/threonine protein kinase/ribosomal protein L40E